ncbi:hypothetical protein [Hyphomicrobium sp. CS1GBMeth3]|uniref:hypothetical protein n=1 Tax=Hyphomicrobium sp. CS1GBMeth3 TaxID=1892845 RepID=UPI0009302AA6|nr:hypothetical protein [Hyphomicrobium sp. CS1GBMeth3]
MTSTAQRLSLPIFLSCLVLGASALHAGPGAGGGAPQTTIEGEAEATPPPIDMTTDWPCVQRKVESISAAQIWDGPPIEGVKGWFREPGIPDLIELLASRRISLDDAEAAIQKFAKDQPEDKRDEKLTLLFAGLFDKVAGQRRSVMSGIEKYQKSQKERAKELERQSTAIVELEKKVPSGSTEDPPNLADAREKFNWAQRIFQERQTNIPLACEIPVLIEEHLYAVTRAIRNNMTS